jgi:TPR repeat protein
MTDADVLKAGLNAYLAKNYDLARHIWEPLAERHNPEAQYWIGYLHYHGQGVPQDYSESAKWYRLAADSGFKAAQLVLGDLYEKGLGVPKDYVSAVGWYRRLAEQGEASGQWALGKFFEKGQGLNQDFCEAARWYKLAANQGFAFAQCSLGKLYETGRGAPQNDAKAFAFYESSANQDCVQAQVYISFMYANGRGVTQDYVAACMWARLALSKMNPGETFDVAKRNIMMLEQRMNPAQIVEAAQRAKDRATPTIVNQISAIDTNNNSAQVKSTDDGLVGLTPLGVIGFIVGLALTVLAEGLLLYGMEVLSGRRMRPFWFGWITGPVIGGIAGSHLLRRANLRGSIEKLKRQTLNDADLRLVAAVYISWALVYISYFFITEENLSYWYRYHADSLWWVLLLPPTVCVVVALIFRWARKGR